MFFICYGIFFAFFLCPFLYRGGRQNMHRHLPASPFLFSSTFRVSYVRVCSLFTGTSIVLITYVSEPWRRFFGYEKFWKDAVRCIRRLIGTPGVRLLGVNRKLLRVRPHVCIYRCSCSRAPRFVLAIFFRFIKKSI